MPHSPRIRVFVARAPVSPGGPFVLGNRIVVVPLPCTEAEAIEEARRRLAAIVGARAMDYEFEIIS
jgi:hypothetical protein